MGYGSRERERETTDFDYKTFVFAISSDKRQEARGRLDYISLVFHILRHILQDGQLRSRLSNQTTQDISSTNDCL
jgi:hypothetical protein